jgi:hypothetical protein
MNKIIHLAEQHILESQSHLRHIDEMMARAQEARAENAFKPEVETELARIQSARDKGEEELNAIQQQPSDDSVDTVQRSEGLSGVLHTVGLELEKALTSVFLPASNADDADGY